MHARYQEWLEHLFDHPERDSEWHWAPDAPYFEASDMDIVELITLTFERSGTDLAHFSDGQLNTGLNYLASSSCGDYLRSLQDSEVALDAKLAGVNAIFVLYRELFAVRCPEVLGHLDEPGASPLNMICYMFWDMCPLGWGGEPAEKEAISEAIIWVLEKSLTINHRACREGALHGLGHLDEKHETQVHGIIDAFVATAELDPDLRSYAEAARAGYIQ